MKTVTRRNTKVSSLSLPGPRNRRRQRRWQRTRNIQCFQGIGYLGTMMEATTSRWQALGIGNQNGGVDRRRWAGGLDDGKGCVNWGSRRYTAYEWTYPTAEALVCLQAAQGLDNVNKGVNWGSRRYNVSEWTSQTAEAPVCLWAQVIDNDDGGVGRVIQARGLNNNFGGVGRGRVIRYASEGLDGNGCGGG